MISLDKKLTTAYTIGFILSVILTLMAFLVVHDGLLQSWWLTIVLLLFATIQLTVQLLFFLHLDSEGRPRWNLAVFSFMALVLGIIVLGSLWIMNSLSYHTTHNPSQLEQDIIKDERIYR